MDVNMAYGVPPIEQRERFREAHDLIRKAWTSKDIFAWNGKYFQLPMVNLWPRPIQQPHPPIWIPGTGSTSTCEYAVDHDYCYCFLSYFGNKSASHSVKNGYWKVVQKKGRDMNPYRLGFAQVVAVAETDAQAEKDYARHIEYLYHKLLHIPLEWFSLPGYQDYRSLGNALRNPVIMEQFLSLKNRRFKDFARDQFVICGSPATVRDQLKEACEDLRIGNLMVLLQMGSMPHELALKNTDLFFKEVAPALRDMWDDEWENHWWPKPLRHQHTKASVAS
jgi:alkanesulfonate monooxygenase SsuD/methylene tetrahydromethanopterin reductase-like flavin-dependent oxidoreductase (luciferase family)